MFIFLLKLPFPFFGLTTLCLNLVLLRFLATKFFFKGNLGLKLTEKEIEIILYLNNEKIKHDVTDLQKNIWGYSADMETHTVETHIYRLRKKISDLFKDEKFILSHKNGYFID